MSTTAKLKWKSSTYTAYGKIGIVALHYRLIAYLQPSAQAHNYSWNLKTDLKLGSKISYVDKKLQERNLIDFFPPH